MRFELIYADNEEELWEIGSWMYKKNRLTGQGTWDHYSNFDDDTFEWKEGSPFAEEHEG